MRTSTTVNAGSMADIAFLMLIFFLTTTTIETDKGLSQTLPDPCLTKDCSSEIVERNLLFISINEEGSYLIQKEIVPGTAVSDLVKDFVLNKEESKQQPATPQDALISLQISRSLDYEKYVEAIDKIKTAYEFLRSDYAENVYGKKLKDLDPIDYQRVIQRFPINLAESNN